MPQTSHGRQRSHHHQSSSPPTDPTLIVGVPARNEAGRIAATLDSILSAADRLPDAVAVAVIVGCDSCTDGTTETVAGVAARDARVAGINGNWSSAGACRAAAIDVGLASALRAGVAPRDLWIATTDADTLVDLGWLSDHVRSWTNGDHAVAGVVDLRHDEHVPDSVTHAFRAGYAVGVDAHAHVHGANLGVRGDAYLRVGGFSNLAVAEDHALWDALRAAGYECRSSLSLRVATSARLYGRAPGGFADTLRTAVESMGAGSESDSWEATA